MVSFKSRIANGEALLGTFLKTPHPHIVEVLASSGLDCICIDQLIFATGSLKPALSDAIRNANKAVVAEARKHTLSPDEHLKLMLPVLHFTSRPPAEYPRSSPHRPTARSRSPSSS